MDFFRASIRARLFASAWANLFRQAKTGSSPIRLQNRAILGFFRSAGDAEDKGAKGI
jgi:hypothetical protein